jgi:isoleucyl-tRNA synthetase
LTGEQSVHLAEFPVANESAFDAALNDKMAMVMEVVNIGLKQRAEAKIKVRQPLLGIELGSKFEKLLSNEIELQNIIAEELNIKSVKFNSSLEDHILIKTEITDELRLEGIAREIIRFIQEMRKEAGYDVDNHIKISYTGMSNVFEVEELKDLIAKETLSDEIIAGKNDETDLTKEFNVDDEKLSISVKK